MNPYYAARPLLVLLLAPLGAVGDGAGVLIQRQGDRLVLGYDTGAGGEGSQGLGGRAFSGNVDSDGFTQFPSFLSLTNPPTGSESLPTGTTGEPGRSVNWDFLPLSTDGVTSNLMHWDGQGPFSLTPASASSLTLFDPSFSAASVQGEASAVPGLRLGTTLTNDPLYRLHAHRLWLLGGDANTGPADGVYVTAMRVRMDDHVPTEPFYVALGTSGVPDATLAQATQWLDQNADALVLPGDYNFDGLIDDDDFAVWASQYGEQHARPVDVGDADGNLDGVINAADYTLWRDAASAAARATSVPEPATALSLLTLLAARASRRSARLR